ncbi:MAG TPA: hypothetical protein VNS34_14695 [Rhizobiaceae bacterium]|nr:hypothetical protein [Rhizobiaceae bacterium]
MVGAFGERAFLGQANGPDVELVVYGTELYARYETLDGYSVVYDETLGLFCYARIVAGCFQSTEVPVTSPPPQGIERHATESDSVRTEKIKERTLQLEQRSRASPKRE